MIAAELNHALNDSLFRFQADEFIRKETIAFKTPQQAKEFLIYFLLVECIAGTILYTDKDLFSCYTKITELVERETVIFSEALPILHPRKQTDKHLQHVYYQLEGTNVCYIKKDCL